MIGLRVAISFSRSVIYWSLNHCSANEFDDVTSSRPITLEMVQHLRGEITLGIDRKTELGNQFRGMIKIIE